MADLVFVCEMYSQLHSLVFLEMICWCICRPNQMSQSILFIKEPVDTSMLFIPFTITFIAFEHVVFELNFSSPSQSCYISLLFHTSILQQCSFFVVRYFWFCANPAEYLTRWELLLSSGPKYLVLENVFDSMAISQEEPNCGLAVSFSLSLPLFPLVLALFCPSSHPYLWWYILCE